MHTHPYLKLIVLILALMLLSGCNAAAETPASEVAAQPPTLTAAEPTPSPDPLGEVKSISLEIQQEFQQLPEGVPLPIEEVVQRTLAQVGVQVVDQGQPSDATLTFNLMFNPLAAEIKTGLGTVTCYNGAEVTGQMTLSLPDQPPIVEPIQNVNPVETMFLIGCPTIAEAPYAEIWPRAVLEPLVKIWDHALLLKAIEDEDPAIRKQAVSLLADHQPEPPEAVEGLLKALQDQDVDVFLYAATALGQRKETAAVPFLITALKNEEKRFYAIIALRDLGPGAIDAVPGLIQVLEDEGVIDWQKREAQDTLKVITGQDLGEDPIAWKEWWQKQQ